MRFYVYDLIDPRTGNVFYVGKGCGRRAHQHTKDEASGRIVNLAKSKVLEELRRAMLKAEVRFFAEGLEEGDAYRIERERIAQLPNLTNYGSGQMTEAQRAAAKCGRLLERIKPFGAWLSERERTEYDIRAYGEIVTALTDMAKAA